MTTNDYIQRLREKDNLIRLKQFVGLAASTIHVQMSNRIFDDGKNSNDDKIGSYNTTNELYVNPNKSPKKFPTKGKNGQTKFANGKPHVTGYFSSYQKYKGSQGRETSFVDLTLWGDLRNNFKGGLTESGGKWIVTVRDNNAKKIEGNESKYGEIFTATEQEKENFKKLINNEIIKILKK
jgi:uncharacterized protein YjbJ (UPF0337 family)